jgi:hypothetical protein
MLINRN